MAFFFLKKRSLQCQRGRNLYTFHIPEGFTPSSLICFVLHSSVSLDLCTLPVTRLFLTVYCASCLHRAGFRQPRHAWLIGSRRVSDDLLEHSFCFVSFFFFLSCALRPSFAFCGASWVTTPTSIVSASEGCLGVFGLFVCLFCYRETTKA